MAKHEHEHDADVIDRPQEENPPPQENKNLPVRQDGPLEPFQNTEYDTPPKEWVAGTVVPKDTAPEDMTDAEYIQWMYENLTPFWAIKRNMLLRRPPELTSIEPNTARIGQESFILVVSGVGLIQESVIVFAGQDEPSKLETNGTLTTGVNMSVWHGPDEVEVRVKNGEHVSEPLMFTFTDPEEDEAKLKKRRADDRDFKAKLDRDDKHKHEHEHADEHKHEHADYPPSEEEDDEEEEDDGKGDKKKKRGKHKK